MRSVLRITTVAILFLVFSLSAVAQHNHNGFCGTVDGAGLNRLIKNKEAIKTGIVKKRGAITYVPMKYVLVSRTNGTGRVTEEAVLDMHCHLNEVYLPQDIQFYIKDGTFKYLDNDAVYSDHRRTINTFMNVNKDNKAVTTFLVKNVDLPGTAGDALAYYDGQRDWMVVQNDQVNKNSQTFPHELGHFFSLQHPHRGWGSAPFASGEPGWPMAPAISPDGPITELADGSNCEEAADMLCDTPADYNGLFTNGCVYNSGALDPKGEPIDPSESLIMSYFGDNCVTEFTDDQKAVIEADLVSSERDRLEKNWTPPSTTVSDKVFPVYPPEDSPVAVSGGAMTVDWANVTGATHYIFELATNAFFSSSEKWMVEGSSIDLTDLTNRKYFYRIRPFNAYNTCANVSTVMSFTINNNQATSTQEIDFVKNFSVFPNPASRSGQIFVSVNSKESFNGEISVLDFTGKAVYQSNENFAAGDNQIPVELNIDANGVYLMFIKSEAGILKQKFVVNE